MTQPAGQSCANCVFYIGLNCHRPLPGTTRGSSWPAIEPADWCAFWNIWPQGPGNSAVAGAAISSGGAAPAGGADGDYYVKYTLALGAISALSIYQKQAGNWVVIQTIL